ncbi:MAG TPA: ornithine carbamoyltransferase [Acidimicrobiales bacterium]
MTVRHFLEITDLDRAELTAVLDLAEAPSLAPVLHHKGVALIFEKPSNRTRQSMELAVVQLGGHPVYTRGDEVGFDAREPVEDVARIMAGFHAVLAARVFEHEVLLRMAAVSTVPVVNLLSERSHPMQALADVLTMRQTIGALERRTVAWVGDYNNVARSLGEASAMLGMHVRFGCPAGYGPVEAELERLQQLGAATVVAFPRLEEAVVGADAVHTDVWTSMGQESEEAARRKAFEGWIVTDEVMETAGPHALFFHCMPAHRGDEVTASVMDGPRSRAIQQGHNRMHAARGLLAFLLGLRP